MLYLLKTMVMIDVLMAVGLVLFRYALAPRYRSIVSAKIVALALITPAVALFCGNIFIFCAYLAVVVAFNARSRAELAATYVFLLPLMPQLSIETGVGGLYLLSISAVGAMGLGALIGYAVGQRRRSLAQTRYDVGVLLLVGVFMVISNHEASVTGLLRGLTVNMLGFVGPYLLISRGISSREDIDRLLLRLALGAVLVAVTACFQAQKHWLLFEIYHRALHAPVAVTSWTLSMRGGMLRTGGSMLDYSAAGLFLAAALTLMPTLRSRFTPGGFWGIGAILLLGLLATQSRGAWLGAVVGFLFISAYRGRWLRVALVAGTAVVGEALILLFAQSGLLGAIAGRTEEANSTLSYRRLLFSRGMDQVWEHPLLGQAPDRLVANLPDLIQGQQIVDFVNAHLYVAMTAGAPLFLVWCYVWLRPVADAWQRRSRRTDGFDLMEVPAAIIVPVMVTLAATSIMDRNLTWPTIAVALAGPCLALSRRGRAGQTDAERPRPSLVTTRRAVLLPAE